MDRHSDHLSLAMACVRHISDQGLEQLKLACSMELYNRNPVKVYLHDGKTEAKVGMRVWTRCSMADPTTHHLAGKEGVIVKVGPQSPKDWSAYPVHVLIDGQTDSTPFRENELATGTPWWRK